MKNALIVWGGWDGHEPKQCADLFAAKLSARGFQVDVANTLDAFLQRQPQAAPVDPLLM